MKLRDLVPNFYIHGIIYSHHRSAYLLYCVCEPTVEILYEKVYINRSQIHECRNCMVTGPRRVISGNICFEFSKQYICSVIELKLHETSIYNFILPF